MEKFIGSLMMDLETFRVYCLSKPGTTESFPFGEEVLVFKVLDKMFATLRLDGDDPRANLKCDPERAIGLREAYHGVEPGYHMNKQHWNTVHLAADLDHEMIRELVDHSYDLIVGGLPQKKQRALNLDQQ